MANLDADLVVMLLVGVALAGWFLVVVRRSPRTALVLWFVTMILVPIWVSVTVGVSLPILAFVGIGLSIGLLSLAGNQTRLGVLDLLVAGIFVISLGPFLIGRLSLASASGVISVWMASFLVGRLLVSRIGVQWIQTCVAVVFTIVAVLALIEFVTGWHGLAQWGPTNAAKITWAPIQGRGGLERSEGAFGHSIALGCSLAMAMVLTLGARFSVSVRISMVITMLAGTAVTVSRVGLVCAVLGLALALVFSRSTSVRELRRPLGWIIVVGGAVLTVLALMVYSEAEDELEGSAGYRGDLVSLLPYIDLFGVSPSMTRTADGTMYFGRFRSIDSQLVLLGLSYGWLALAAVVLVLLVAVVAVLARRANLATIAVVAQLPALSTVALITQYAYLFWFVAGVAVAAASDVESTRLAVDSRHAGESSWPIGRGARR